MQGSCSIRTAGRFPVFIFDTEHLHNAIHDVRRHNQRAPGRRRLPANPYPWITPAT